jgi:hypothetical protein
MLETIAWMAGGWLIASAIWTYFITRWFRYQRDCDAREKQ